MARVVNPYNLDDSDDAVFAYLLSEGLIWIEDDDDSYNDVPLFEMIHIEEISGATTHTLKGHTDKINALAISNEFVISASSDNTLRVWHWQTGQELAILNGHTGSVNEVIISGDFAISASSDKTLRVWNWKIGQLLRTFDDFKYDISEIALTGQFVFTVSVSTIRIWNWQTGEFIQQYRDGIGHIVVDGDLLLIVRSSHSLRVKNWKTDQPLHDINVKKYVESLFLNDDLSIFIDEFDGIRVWNWKTGEYFDESEFETKSRSKITNKILHNPSELYIYDAKTNKCYFHMYDYDEVIIFSDDYSHIITSNGSSTIQVAFVSPILHKLANNLPVTEQSSEELTPQYDIDNVLEECLDYIRKRNEQWVNFTRVSQHLYKNFPNLNLKALGHSDKNYKNLRYLIADYPSKFEIRQDPEKQGLYWARLKPQQSSNKQHKPKNKTEVVRDYNIDVVLQTARDFVRKRNEKWVNFTRVSQHLYNTFDDLEPKKLGSPNKKYQSLLKLIADYPSDFELRQDSEKQGLYWIRLKSKK